MKKSILIFFFLSILTILAFTFASSSSYILTLNLNTSLAWWNDSINASGEAKYLDGTPITGSVSLRVDKIYSCPDSTDGNWYCLFNAPNEIGSFLVLVNITNSSGFSFYNQTILKVSPNYGKKPISSTDRVVFELPMIIQDLNGEIKRVLARIIVWRD